MKKKIRYAVIGLGHIAQTAVLPAFKHAGNSELAAFITGDPKKDRELSKHYEVKAYNYDDLESALETERIDALYIATPNMLHREHAERAAGVGAHVLCEKPMANTQEDCDVGGKEIRTELGKGQNDSQYDTMFFQHVAARLVGEAGLRNWSHYD